MNFSNAASILGNTYQYANKVQKTTVNSTSFTESLQGVEKTGAERVDAYKKYLAGRYGVNVSVQSIGKDQASLERVGKSMSGSDVIIAPNILEQMANDSKKAAYYEGKISHFFNDIVPQETALCAAKGLVYEPGGVVIHEDGTVTYISGCSDSPERVAEVNAINKAKREKEAAQRKANLERSQEAAEARRELMEIQYQKQAAQAALNDRSLDTEANYYIVGQSQAAASAVTAYEKAISTYSNSLLENI